MAKYKFRLTALQHVREAQRDKDRAALAEAYRAQEMLAQRGAVLDAEEAELRHFELGASADRCLDVNRLLEAQRYELVLKARRAELVGHQALLAAEVERRRQQLVEADREVRVLERLEERGRQEFARQQRRLEIKQLDEVANRPQIAWGTDHQ